MSIIPTWCPPSREHWELVTFLWQFFPIVRYAFPSVQMTSANRTVVAHFDPMGRQLLSHGQDLDHIYSQYPGQDWLGDYGGAWLHHSFVHHVQSAEARGD